MISDVLHETVWDLDDCLTNPTLNETYKGRLKQQIIKLRDEALYIARVLDTWPGERVPPKAQGLARIAEERRQMPRASA